MGNWAIVIHGTGVHHNTRDAKDGQPASVLAADANILAAEFVKLLKEKGHSVSHASITAGAINEITDADAYLKSYKPEGATVR